MRPAVAVQPASKLPDRGRFRLLNRLPMQCYQIVITYAMMTSDRDPALDTLLDLHGQTLFVDEAGHTG